MENILLIETATRVCSVAIAIGGKVGGLAEDNSSQYSHSSQLTGFIEKVIKEAGMQFSQLDAVAVSMGPGSYTGLRIGVSVAKGLCYGLDIPLIAVNTLSSMASVANSSKKEFPAYLVPMIDARRMEVYSAVFSNQLQPIRDTRAEIITGESFSEFLNDGRVAFFGDGAAKCREAVTHKNAIFYDDFYPSATGMATEASRKYSESKFEDVAYFEPFYLKDFVAGKPRVKGLI